jgi:dihydrofolate reductase
MGRKTFESLGKPLPNRTTIIISRNPDYLAEGCIVVNSLPKAIKAAREDENPYILGGAEIYRQAMEFADFLDLTLVHQVFEGDAFFPEIDLEVWTMIKRVDFKADEVNQYDYSFVQYKKK